MSKRHNKFRNETKENNYTKTSTVVQELIEAVEKYKKFELLDAGGDPEGAAQKLIDAGTQAYQAMEHAYKNYIYRHYYTLFNDKKTIKWAEFNRETAFENTGRHFTHADLKKKFCEIVEAPQPNLNLIMQGAEKSNNKPKHDAKVPDPKELKAQLIEMIKFFRIYLDGNAEYPSLADSFAGEQHAWQTFYEKVGGFGSEYQYMLITPSGLAGQEDLKLLFNVNWDLILDFDPCSDDDGIQSVFTREHGISPISRTLSNGEKRRRFQPTSYPQWIMANGFADNESGVTDNFVKWRRIYGQNFKEVIQRFQEVYPKYLKVVVLPGMEAKYLEYLIEQFADIYASEDGESIYGVDIVLLDAGESCLGEDYTCITRSDVTMEDFLEGLRSSSAGVIGAECIKTMPGVQDAGGLNRDLCAKLENFCQPVYIGVENMEEEQDVADYYRAQRPISWMELACGKDLQRSIYTTGIYSKLESLMGDHPKLLYDIVYKPGYGGSTMLRRIAWDFHNQYPTLILQRYEEEYIHCLRQLYEKTKRPFLVLVDSNLLTRTEAQAIRQDLRRENINHVVLFMRRRSQTGEAAEKSELFDIPELSYDKGEAQKMVDMLLPHVSNSFCRSRVLDYREDQNAADEKSPFFFALSAFEEEFKGIPKYVHNFMELLPSNLKEYLVFIALADYINKPLDMQFFVGHMRNDKVEEFLNRQLAFRSLVTFYDLKGQRYCKIKHATFATEILRQYTAGYSEGEPKPIQFPKLVDAVLNFIEYSRPNSRIVNNNLTDFLREMLITRREDIDAEKPKFSKLISKIGNYDAVRNQWPQEGKAAVGRIFHKLAEVYPDDPHFNAHLARYLCYVEKDYDNAITKLNEAIDSRDDRAQKDPLLLHMKAMVYAARITKKTIPAIKSQFYVSRDENVLEPLMLELRRDCGKAQEIFEEVRKLHSGMAGHISDIQLCINIIDMKKTLEGVDTARFWEYHPTDWYMELADHANALYDACEEYSDDAEGEDRERLKEIEGAVMTIRKGIDASVSWYQEYLENAPNSKRPYLRRHLARACMERNMERNSQEEWRYIANLMEENMREEPENEANIRTWFNAVVHIRSDDPDDMLRQAIIRLNEWVALSEDNIDAHFYRYILTFIQAVEGMSSAEGLLKQYMLKIRSMTRRLENRTTIRYWLGNSGRGMERLISRSNFPVSHPEAAISKLYILKGRVDEYISDVHAYIKAYNSDVFFTPYSTSGQVSQSSVRSLVSFGVGFSYDGPRAYNASVKPYTGEDLNLPADEVPELKFGTWVRCKVVQNSNPYYINVELVGYPGEKGSIPVEQLAEPYSAENRPEVEGRLLDAMVLRRKSIRSAGGYRDVWELTMCGGNFEQQEEKNNPLQGNEKLKAMLEQMRREGRN